MAGVAGGIGEGVTTMGQQAEQIRTDEHNPSRELDPMQAALAAGSGAVTGLIGAGSGTLAKKLGIENPENLLAGVHADPVAKAGLVRRVIGGAVTEGLLEELPQSVQEQVAQNIATHQPWDTNVDQQAVLGTLSGGVMGAGAQFFHGGHTADPLAKAKSDKAMDDIAGATTADEAIAAFANTHIPLNVPTGFDAEGAMARMERANANDESLMHDRTGTMAPEVARSPQMTGIIGEKYGPGDTTNPVTGERIPAPPPVPNDGNPPPGGGTPSAEPTLEDRMQAGVPESFQDRLAVVREKLADSRTRQQIRDISGSQVLGDALYFAKSADDATLPGKTSDAMLTHAERLLDEAGVAELPRETMAAAKAQSLVEKRTAAQAKIDETNKAKETVAPAARTTELAAAAAAPGAGLKERAAASKERQKAALLTGNAVVNEEALLEPLPKAAASTTPGEVDEAAHQAAPSPKNDLPEPTQAQKEAGNYQLGHARIGGLDLSIENPEGSTRSGTDASGKRWSNTLQHHYGYIKGTIGNDKDHVDAFVKPGTATDYAGPVFVVDQVHVDAAGARTSKFDEHKALIGFDTIEEAKDAYRANYAKGWNGMQAISTMPMAEFDRWVKDGPKTEPLAPVSGPTLKERAEAMKERNKPAPAAEPTSPLAETAKPQPVSTVTTPAEVAKPVADSATPEPTPAEPYAHLEGKTIEQKVTVADTGQTATLRMDAAEAMRDLDRNEAALLELQGCLKRAA
jgi:hypothetical protein